MKNPVNLKKRIAIGLSGFKKSGKTTVKEVMEKRIYDILGIEVKEIMMADHLKETCARLCNVPRFHMDSQDHKEVPWNKPIIIDEEFLSRLLDSFNVLTLENLKIVQKHKGTELTSPRHALQYVGTNILREIDPGIHLKIALKNARDHDAVVFTDCRFLNEVEGVRELTKEGFTVAQAWIDRPEITEEAKRLNEKGELHFSESSMLEFCDTLPQIKNDQGLKELEENATQTLTKQLGELTKASGNGQL